MFTIDEGNANFIQTSIRQKKKVYRAGNLIIQLFELETNRKAERHSSPAPRSFNGLRKRDRRRSILNTYSYFKSQGNQKKMELCPISDTAINFYTLQNAATSSATLPAIGLLSLITSRQIYVYKISPKKPQGKNQCKTYGNENKTDHEKKA